MDKLAERIATLSNALLVTTLTTAEATLESGSIRAEDGQYWRLVRARLIEEVERRWPAAEAAANNAFDEWSAAYERGEDPDDVDYVAVLLTAVPV